MDIYLRHVDNADGARVGEMPFSEAGIDEAMRIVKGWEVYTDATGDSEPFLFGQLRLADGKVFFEIVVGRDDA